MRFFLFSPDILLNYQKSLHHQLFWTTFEALAEREREKREEREERRERREKNESARIDNSVWEIE